MRLKAALWAGRRVVPKQLLVTFATALGDVDLVERRPRRGRKRPRVLHSYRQMGPGEATLPGALIPARFVSSKKSSTPENRIDCAAPCLKRAIANVSWRKMMKRLPHHSVRPSDVVRVRRKRPAQRAWRAVVSLDRDAGVLAKQCRVGRTAHSFLRGRSGP